jgi:3-hydroxybutyryl-CoA dehydrogenase
MPLNERTRVGVLGAGAMGRGIAQVAAWSGHEVVVLDPSSDAIRAAQADHLKLLEYNVEKNRMTAAEAEAAGKRIDWVASKDDFARFRECGLVIEAIVEDLGVKRAAFQSIEQVVADDCVLASNTSSLSIAAIASACRKPGRVIGLHFFNPPTILKLVEVIGAIPSDTSVVAAARDLVRKWGKVVVTARDTPGFIVNRVARPFYGEALRIHEEGIADFATIDWAMMNLGGFKMGPFALMDLIGNDVNYAVTQSVFEAMYYDPRYKPSVTQRRMVEAGKLGRKSRVGYYDYTNGAPIPEPTRDQELGRRIFDRVLAMLINEAADAVHFNVASVEDVDLAMTKGVNYPKGLLAWADELGAATVYDRLVALQDEYREDRYRPSPLLRKHAKAKTRFHG